MFGTRLLERRSKPARITGQAWDRLVSAADDTGDRAGVVAKVARQRASRTYDALAGRRRRPWGWLVGVGLTGLAIGWTVGMLAARAQQQIEAAQVTTGSAPVDEESQTVEFVDVDQPIR